MSEKYELIDVEKATVTETGDKKYTITVMCEWLEVSSSGYYEWRDRPESATAQRRHLLTLLVKKAFDDSDETSTFAVMRRRGPRLAGLPGFLRLLLVGGMVGEIGRR